ncbi:MAG: hypothetical protein LBV69_10570 [Bacteroidales bacterium]|jgi:hypothetical protein|nr:hypothetical protein [Bacteroidales bacterium]
MDKIKEKLNTISVILKLSESAISQLEKDLLLQYTRELYMEIINFQVTEKTSIENNTKISAIENAKISIPTIEILPIHVEEQKSEAKKTIEQKKEIQKQIETQTENQEPKSIESKTVGETLGKDKTSLYDKLAGNQQTDISKKMSQQPISDIKSAIPIGEKFLYIRELFNNDSDKFNEAIELLNKFSSFDDAINFLMFNYKINEENEHLVSFFEIVRRKYL